MSDWTLVPCLVTLRGEFNAVAPGRDKGSDGSIGDSNHKSSSDHTPDEDSDILRDHDADTKNEVHALDIDSTGPWPGGAAWFDAAIKAIVDRHRRGDDDRLQYVIWNHMIANASIDNWRWRTYTSTTDPHTDHAHFSSRYTSAQEADTRPWGVKGILEMELDDLLWTGTPPDSWTSRYPTSAPTVRNVLAFSAYDSTDAEKIAGRLETKMDQIIAELSALGGGAHPLDLDAIATDMSRRLGNG